MNSFHLILTRRLIYKLIYMESKTNEAKQIMTIRCAQSRPETYIWRAWSVIKCWKLKLVTVKREKSRL